MSLPQITICDCVTERTGVPHVFIPRAEYEAKTWAAKALQDLFRDDSNAIRWTRAEAQRIDAAKDALAALRAAGIQQEGRDG